MERPSNQFDSGRVVLYGCHCGCDYCGIISCEVRIEPDRALWRDICYENDNGDLDTEMQLIADLVFNPDSYRREIIAYCARCGLDMPGL